MTSFRRASPRRRLLGSDVVGGGYRNPLYPVVLADPFVLKFNGSYYAYGTPASGAIPVLASPDLVNWTHAGVAVAAPPSPNQRHWAPEVAYENGRFFIYYSTGGPEGEGHQLRVAVATAPTGPFDERHEVLDRGDPFTIDGHPFHDDDGEWYLFYSRDFLEGHPIGTGIVVDRLLDMVRLAGERATVLRPHAEWHIYERDRRWYDRVWDWFTVEGPFVRKHEGRYWCFYSGGAWHAANYGVSCAVADHPLGPYETVGAPEGATILRTVPGRAIGPGHASVVLAPDNISEYLVYHAWDPPLTGRYMFADPLSWAQGRPASSGPSTERQPAPPLPALRDLFDGANATCLDPGRWWTRGRWEVHGGEAAHPVDATSASAIVTITPSSSYLLEVNLRLLRHASSSAVYGVLISYHDEDTYDAVLIHAGDRCVIRRCRRNGTSDEMVLGRLAKDFDPAAYHQLLVRRTADALEATLDGVRLQPAGDGSRPGAVGLWTNGPSAFTGVALTDLQQCRSSSSSPRSPP